MEGGKVHVIHFAGSLNQGTADALRDICLQALQHGAGEIRLHLACDGGSNFYGFALYGFLRSLPIPLVTHNIGNIESMGVVVYMAGHRRIVSPHGRFLIHPMHWGFNGGPVDYSRLREFNVALDDDVDRYVQVFNERREQPKNLLDIRQHLTTSEKIIGADASTDFGIAHAVEEARLPIDSVKWWVGAPK